MLRTYEGILDGNQIDWVDEAPAPGTKVRVYVTVVEDVTLDETEEEKRARGERMRNALENLANANAFASIEDPVAWQREIRRDRPLPGREIG